MTITMKTADHLSGRAAEIAAIAEALYEAGFRREGGCSRIEEEAE